jgi:hypothetical protein
MKILILFLLIVNFVSAVNVNFNCPASVGVGEEFECSLQISQTVDLYDLKIEIEKDNKNVAKIWDEIEEKWQSAYYYLKNLSGDGEKSVKVIIENEGEYDGILKIRYEGKTESFNFSIVANNQNSPDIPKDKNTEKENISKVGILDGKNLADKDVVKKNENVSEGVGNFFKKESANTVINLNNARVNSEKEVVYESKNFKVLKYLPYGFCLFLIFIIGILLKEKA